MNLFQFIGRYFWAVCLAFSAFNYVSAARRMESANHIGWTNLDEAKRYLQLFALAGAAPWLVMGFGQVVGGVPSVWHFFRPMDGNPYVISWIASVFLLSVCYAYWVLFRGGATKVREYDLMSVFGKRATFGKSITFIKLMAAIGPFFVIGWVWFTTFISGPIPK